MYAQTIVDENGLKKYYGISAGIFLLGFMLGLLICVCLQYLRKLKTQ